MLSDSSQEEVASHQIMMNEALGFVLLLHNQDFVTHLLFVISSCSKFSEDNKKSAPAFNTGFYSLLMILYLISFVSLEAKHFIRILLRLFIS